MTTRTRKPATQPSITATANAILQAIRSADCQASEGAAVALCEVRQHLGAEHLANFATALFSLANADRVYLHPMDHTDCLTSEEQADLITDSYGRSYTQVALAV